MGKQTPYRVPLNLRDLSGNDELFRLCGATPRDPAVERWFAGDPRELRSLAQPWFARLRNCGRDVLEMIHDGGPVACVGDAPFAYVNSFKRHLNVGFFWGVALEDPAGLLQGSGKRMRHVKLHPNRTVNAAALTLLIEAAYTDIKTRLGSAPG